MINDYTFIATVDEDTIVVTTDATCDSFHVRTTNDELKERFLRFVETEQEVRLLPVAQRTHTTGKGSLMKVAASIAGISSALQFVDIPPEVEAELRKLSQLPPNNTKGSVVNI